ncbi:MAG: zinc protease [Rhodospirillales bacterium RIFCSPLOWO2_12_FULL_58_28]|nr:MAG: zinc protease [Rhodospirillales bacterium RIFCSPLOWO2_02_FULL_58_16]OHC78721.1 MAG: zinc protease [Rhodospirillales bacterium RIFCSPLOWO2_12_FULL_58_28]
MRAALVVIALFLMAPPAMAVDVQKVVSKSGLEAWLVEDHANPIISLHFAFRGGAALDPDGKEGVADMTASTLDEGAGDMDSQAFQGRLDGSAITLSFKAGHDAITGRVETLTATRDQAFELLHLALTAPRFDQEPVSRIRDQILAALRVSMEDPSKIAGRKLMAVLFPGHPYGRPVEGTPESISAVTIEDIRAFAKGRLARDNLVIGAVGDITPDELSRIIESTFGGLPAKAAPWEIPQTRPASDGRTVVIAKPVPQSAVSFAQQGLKRNDADFYAAFIINHVLGGGGFGSRLFSEVRDKRGLAYSIHSYLYPLDAAALVSGSAGTANAAVAETLRLVREEWRKMAEQGISEKELADTKTYLTGSFPLRFSSSQHIASILVSMQLDSLGIDYLNKRNSYIEAVTLEDANRVARSLLKPETLTMVVVGEPKGLTDNK